MIFESSIPESFFKEYQFFDASFMDELEKKYHSQGWYNFIDDIDFPRVEKELSRLSTDVDIIISIGVGGSYMGLKSLVQFLGQEEKWLFLGPSLDTEEILATMEKLQEKRVGILLISKSGKTFEVQLFFTLCQKLFKQAVWIAVISSCQEFHKRVSLKLDREVSYFLIDQDTGGRYSLLSMMGLVTMYLLGVDWKAMILTLQQEKKRYQTNFFDHPAYKRGVGRFLLQTLYGVSLEVLSTKDKKLNASIKWLEQLFAESDGKEGKGLFIGRAFYPQDAHSIGQIMAQGKRVVAETFYLLDRGHQQDIQLPETEHQIGNIKSLQDLGDIFISGIKQDRANHHIIVQSYTISNHIQDLLTLFFYEMLAVSLEGYLLGINPFNQPGVEGYKFCIKNKVWNSYGK